MARSKRLENYGEEFYLLVEAVVVKGTTVRVRVDGRQEAWRLQGRFYSWRQALARAVAAAEAGAGDYTQAQVLHYRDVASWAAKTTCHFDNTLPVEAAREVTFSGVDADPLARKLRQAVANALPEATPVASTEADAMLARLTRIGPDVPQDDGQPPPGKKYY